LSPSGREFSVSNKSTIGTDQVSYKLESGASSICSQNSDQISDKIDHKYEKKNLVFIPVNITEITCLINAYPHRTGKR
jgi:hypothetical protein